MNPLSQAAVFLIQLVGGLFSMVLWLRLLMQYSHANWHNPISQLVIRLTEPCLKPLRKGVPGFAGIDFSIILLVLLVQLAQVVCVFLVSQGYFPALLGWCVWSVASSLQGLKSLLFILVIIGAIASWVPSLSNSPFILIIGEVTLPFYRWAQKITPRFSGIDLSPLVIIVVLTLIDILFISPFVQFGMNYSLR